MENSQTNKDNNFWFKQLDYLVTYAPIVIFIIGIVVSFLISNVWGVVYDYYYIDDEYGYIFHLEYFIPLVLVDGLFCYLIYVIGKVIHRTVVNIDQIRINTSDK
jgi:hypothetical protein